MLAWNAWLILAAVSESFTSRISFINWLIMVCAVSSPSEVGVWVFALLSMGPGVSEEFLDCDKSPAGMRGGMRWGECVDLSMKGVKLVDTFTVFIISNCTFGRALAQPIWLHSTWKSQHLDYGLVRVL